MNENEIAKIVFENSLKIHKELGPGLLESAYEECLYFELQKTGLDVQRQVGLPLIYGNVKMEIGYRVDLLIEKKVIVELKSVDAINEVHIAQIITYCKLYESKLGLLINFNVPLLKNGFRRIANNL
ncbi:MAG: GxxExxY protein [Crocinitomicaceae bacterium]|nr:GxxExxY protein [Crocinitomicaceae bacterium]